jgi:hypothetical protein
MLGETIRSGTKCSAVSNSSFFDPHTICHHISWIEHIYIAGEYKNFILGYGKWLLIFYGIFAALGFTVLAPLFAVLLVLAPGMIMQALMAIPHFAFDFACHDKPQLFSDVFLNQFRRVNPTQSVAIKEGLKKHPYRMSILGRLEDRALRWFYFMRTSTVYGVIGFIPIIGPIISTVGQVRVIPPCFSVATCNGVCYSHIYWSCSGSRAVRSYASVCLTPGSVVWVGTRPNARTLWMHTSGYSLALECHSRY